MSVLSSRFLSVFLLAMNGSLDLTERKACRFRAPTAENDVGERNAIPYPLLSYYYFTTLIVAITILTPHREPGVSLEQVLLSMSTIF